MERVYRVYRRRNKLEDFHTKYLVDVQTQCWEWQGCKDELGYGQWRWRSKNWPAHRISMLIDGNDPQGYQVNHHCDNPSCVNPQHLYLGTQEENMRDMVQRGRQKCIRGTKHHNSKLSEQDVLDIRADTISSLRVLSAQYKVSMTIISLIRRRKSWTHI